LNAFILPFHHVSPKVNLLLTKTNFFIHVFSSPQFLKKHRKNHHTVDGNQKSGEETSSGKVSLTLPLVIQVLAPSQVVGLGISEPSTVGIFTIVYV